MKNRIEVAGVLRQLRLANIRNKFEAEEQVSITLYTFEMIIAFYLTLIVM